MTPEIYFGENKIDEISSFVKGNVLIVCGKSRRYADRIIKNLRDYDVSVFSEVEAEPSLYTLEKCVEQSKGYDTIIGIGGGSAIDVAKAASIIESSTEIDQYLGVTDKISKDCRKIMMPTTTGTGSEVTDVSVFKEDGETKVIYNKNLFSDVVILDPKLTESMPPRLVASTAMDAFSHALESLVSINSNGFSSDHGGKAIETITEVLKKCQETNYENLRSVEERGRLLRASNDAGISFINAGVEDKGAKIAGCGLGHALALVIGKKYNLAHSEAVGMILPHLIEYYFDRDYIDSSFVDPEMSSIVESTLKKFNLPSAAVKEDDVNSIVDSALGVKRLLNNEPNYPEKENVEKIIRRLI